MTMVVRTLRAAPRPGLTLLEVIISLAIFLLSLVAISSLIELGTDTATRANYQTECTRLAQSKLSEVVAGLQPLASSADNPFEEDANYFWTVDCNSNEDLGDS